MVQTDKSQSIRATAAYVAELAGDLAALARGSRLDTLSYILDMARLEAEEASRRDLDPRTGRATAERA